MTDAAAATRGIVTYLARHRPDVLAKIEARYRRVADDPHVGGTARLVLDLACEARKETQPEMEGIPA